MSESIRTSGGNQGGENRVKPIMGGERTTMEAAFQKLVREYGSRDEKNVIGTLKEVGAIKNESEKTEASVKEFPFERTRDGHRKLGNEVGLVAGEFIVGQIQNNALKPSSDTMSNMTIEKPPTTTTEKIHNELPNNTLLEKERGALEEELFIVKNQLNDLETKMARGEFSPQEEGGEEGDEVFLQSLKKQVASIEESLGIERAHDIEISSPENPTLTTTETSSIDQQSLGELGVKENMVSVIDPVLDPIQEEMRVLTEKKEKALAEIRDHTKSATEPLKIIHEVNQRIHHFNEERIKADVGNTPPEKLREKLEWAVEQLKDQNTQDKTEATLTKKIINERLGEGKKSQLPTEEQQQRKMNKRSAAVPDVATHVKAVGEIAPEEIVSVTPVETVENESMEPPTEIKDQEKIEEQSITKPTLEEKLKTAYDIAMERIATEDPARAERLLNAIGATPEGRQRIEKMFSGLENFEKNTEALEKEKDPWVLERALKIGSWYRNVSLKKKLIASAFLIGGASALAASGGAGAVMIATAAFTGSGFQRLLGGLAVAATVEGVLTKRSIAHNEGEEKILGIRMNAVLGILAGSGVILGGKLLGEFLSNSGERTTEALTTPETAQEIPAEHLKESVETPMDTQYTEKVGSVREALKGESLIKPSYTVDDDEKLWNILKEKFPEIQKLDGEGKQSNAIANIIEQIRKDPTSYGIASGNVDNLTTGDVLNMEKIHAILENTKISVGGVETNILERAEGLAATEVSTIEANNEKLLEWQMEHPDEQLTTETADKILNEHSPASDTESLSENLNNIRKDMETAEAISMKTEQIFRANIQTMFGSKGLFGYGFLGTNGERSVDWLDLKDRTVTEVMTKKFEGGVLGEEGGVIKFGIDSFSAVDKIKWYMNMLTERTGLAPKETETIDQFIHRAIQVIASK